MDEWIRSKNKKNLREISANYSLNHTHNTSNAELRKSWSHYTMEKGDLSFCRRGSWGVKRGKRENERVLERVTEHHLTTLVTQNGLFILTQVKSNTHSNSGKHTHKPSLIVHTQAVARRHLRNLSMPEGCHNSFAVWCNITEIVLDIFYHIYSCEDGVET